MPETAGQFKCSDSDGRTANYSNASYNYRYFSPLISRNNKILAGHMRAKLQDAGPAPDFCTAGNPGLRAWKFA